MSDLERPMISLDPTTPTVAYARGGCTFRKSVVMPVWEMCLRVFLFSCHVIKVRGSRIRTVN